jgi:hypothetical protein
MEALEVPPEFMTESTTFFFPLSWIATFSLPARSTKFW